VQIAASVTAKEGPDPGKPLGSSLAETETAEPTKYFTVGQLRPALSREVVKAFSFIGSFNSVNSFNLFKVA
jgi:hypothetical protein